MYILLQVFMKKQSFNFTTQLVTLLYSFIVTVYIPSKLFDYRLCCKFWTLSWLSMVLVAWTFNGQEMTSSFETKSWSMVLLISRGICECDQWFSSLFITISIFEMSICPASPHIHVMEKNVTEIWDRSTEVRAIINSFKRFARRINSFTSFSFDVGINASELKQIVSTIEIWDSRKVVKAAC